MRPFAELLPEVLEVGHPGRNEAAEALLRHLRLLVPNRWLLGEADREELVATVLFRILDKPSDFVGKEWPYVVTTMTNALRSSYRQSKRRDAPGDPEPLLLREAAPPVTDPVEVAQRWKLLDAALAHAVSLRSPQYRAPLERSWPLLKELLEAGTPMRELVLREEGLAADAPEQVVKTAIDRHYQAQKRCRAAVAEALEDLAVEGRLGEEDLQVARKQLQGLLRVAPARDRQAGAAVRSRAGGGSSPGNET